MFISAEIRWFYSGKKPLSVQEWFQDECLGNNLTGPDTREDVYLCLPECEFINLKHREGRLELKWRKKEVGVLSLPQQGEGMIQKWIKWPCDDPTVESMIPPDVTFRDNWVCVRKERSQRFYQLKNDDSVVPISEENIVEQGGSVELTQLTVQNQDWWSLGFEVFGSENHLVRVLEAIATEVMTNYYGPVLSRENSYGYPTLLTNFIL